MSAFLRALIGTTQVKGGYYEPTSQACAVAGFVARLEGRPYPLPPLEAAEYAARAPRAPARTVVVAGVSNGIGLALARAHAAPGMRLCLIGGAPAMLEQAAADCRHRGALVETFCPADGSVAAIADFLAGFDRRSPVDALLVQLDASADPGETGSRSDMAAAMGVVAALAEPMRRRGCGNVMLVSSLAGSLVPAEQPRRARQPPRLAGAWRRAGAAPVGRRRGRDDRGPRPAGDPRRRVARAPVIAAVGADRIGAAIAAGLHRHQPVVAVPGAAAAVLRTANVLAARLGEATRFIAVPRVAAITDAPAEPPLAGKSASGGSAGASVIAATPAAAICCRVRYTVVSPIPSPRLRNSSCSSWADRNSSSLSSSAEIAAR